MEFTDAQLGQLDGVRFKALLTTRSTREAMRATVDAIVKTLATQPDPRDARIAAQAKEIERLREALTFYANPEIYQPHPHGPAFDNRDLSYAARSALAHAPGDPT